MQYTIEQLSKLLNRQPRTLYRMHIEHDLGQICDVAEGRRLLFSEEEYRKLCLIFTDNSKDKLLANPTVVKIIMELKKKPMSVYDLARILRVKKSSMQGLIAAMTNEFEELAEDNRGILYWVGWSIPETEERHLVRYVYHSRITGNILEWKTFVGVPAVEDSGYRLLATNRCLYIEDVSGKLAYEGDMVQVGTQVFEVLPEMPMSFKIIGTIYDVEAAK